MANLAESECVPCKVGSPTVTDGEIKQFVNEVPEWKLLEDEGVKKLQREYEFKDFNDALQFTIKVGELANKQGHHPIITTEWGKVTLIWWTHKINGLHRNDFVMAAKCDYTYNQLIK